MYVQVLTDTGRAATMRTAPMHVLVEAPLAATVWGLGHKAPLDSSCLRVADPVNVSTQSNHMYQYNGAESQLIWTYASHYQDIDQN